MWKLFYDWQTLIAGMFALIDGVLAYVAASWQAAEIRRQNRFIQKPESRRLART